MSGVGSIQLLKGDCLIELKRIPDASVDAVVTDPPYGLEFMGKGWDKFTPLDFEKWCEQWARECLRILKPGGHLLAFGGTRTWHRLAAGIEDAGFEIRDSIAWLYGSGMPKSLNVANVIDKMLGVEASELEQRRGWGTALKPAFEPIVLARKPFAGTVAANVLEHGTGALNIDATRIPTTDNLNGGAYAKNATPRRDMWGGDPGNSWRRGGAGDYEQPTGRWPANVVLDESQAEALDEQSGGASRFFYVAKASKAERPVGEDGTIHPTVKPLALMRWLVRLITPAGGVVVDPFAGSGTTLEAAYLEGFQSIGCEMTPEYWPLIEARIERAMK